MESPGFKQCCLFCNERDGVYSITYTSGEYSAKDDIIEFLGRQVESMLDDTDVICNNCMNIFANVANLKRNVYSLICKRINCKNGEQEGNSDNKSLKFSTIWASFSKLTVPREISPAVSENEMVDMNLVEAEHFNNRRRTYSSNASEKNDEDQEIQEAFRPKKKRKEKRILSRSKSANTVIQRSSSECDYLYPSSPETRSYSSLSQPASNFSMSMYKAFVLGSYSRASNNNNNKNIKDYETRSVSRSQDEFYKRLEIVKNLTFYCSVPPCELIFFPTLEQLTEHKKQEHNMMALFWCEECSYSFTSNEDLKKHNKHLHSNTILHCPCCSEILSNVESLQVHLQDHLMYSVPCLYCDKKFLNGKKCEDHVRNMHRGRKKKIRLKRPQSILDRYETSSIKDDVEASTIKNKDDSEFVVKIRIQDYHDKVNNKCSRLRLKKTASVNCDNSVDTNKEINATDSKNKCVILENITLNNVVQM